VLGCLGCCQGSTYWIPCLEAWIRVLKMPSFSKPRDDVSADIINREFDADLAEQIRRWTKSFTLFGAAIAPLQNSGSLDGFHDGRSPETS
jgi:hypothetical protein